MPRLQILQLPEGANDERPPFVLVVDEYEKPGYPHDTGSVPFEGIAEKLGARCVLVFEATVEIPANDLSAYATETADARSDVYLDIQGDFPKFGPPMDGEPLTDPDRVPGRYA